MTTTTTEGLSLEYKPTGKASGTVQLSAVFNGGVILLDKLDIGRASARDRFQKALLEKCPGIDAGDVEAELLRIADEAVLPSSQTTNHVEVDVSRIMRPELFHAPEVSGITVPVTSIVNSEPVARWFLYLRWSDGRRERLELPKSLELPEGGRIWLNPIPQAPTLEQAPAWSTEAREWWLNGDGAPCPVEVFKALCERTAWYLDFPPDLAPGYISTLALWTLLTYAFPAWKAVPYLSLGGPLGSGKSTVFDLLARTVFRPLASANMTAPTLFRSIHEQGGTLLLDEAERLTDNTPDAGELRSILLSGYKQGSPAKRLEATGDGKYITRSFNVYGPKALAAIKMPPAALVSRCITIRMFRAPPDSQKPRRAIDAEPERWVKIRDDLHAMALEYGRDFLQLAERASVAPAMSGRDYQLWQPLLALADWLDERGAAGTLTLMQEHAKRTIAESHEDTTPDADELLLRLLAEAVMAGTNASLTPKALLVKANEREQELFRHWNSRTISSTLARYQVKISKSHGQRTYRDVTIRHLMAVERSYSLDLGLPEETKRLTGQEGAG